MALISCPECGKEISDDTVICPNCKFEIKLYMQMYKNLYDKHLKELDNSVTEMSKTQEIIYTTSTDNQVHNPRCPYCNSENLMRITNMDRVVNIALFGIFGNKRKYQWHCNNCNTNW